MNEISGITMDEQSARAALAAAIKESADAAERADRFAEQFVDAKRSLDAKEEAYITAQSAYDSVIGKCDDAAVLKAFHKASEAKALWDAAKKTTEQATAKVDNARLQCEEAESTVDWAAGAVIAAIAEARAKAFHAQWHSLIAEAAWLHAARRQCGTLHAPVPPELARVLQLGVIGAVANDLRFSESFKTSKTTIAAFAERLASDPAALFEE